MAAGRPTEYDFNLCKEICERVRDGEDIRAIIESSDRYPSTASWYNWLGNHQELLELYRECRRDKSEAKELDTVQIANELRTGKLDPHTAKVLIDLNKWFMGVYNPKSFGNKADFTVDEGNNGGITIEIKNNNSST